MTSSRSFEEVVGALEEALGRPDMNAFSRDVAGATSYAALEEMVRRSLGRPA